MQPTRFLSGFLPLLLALSACTDHPRRVGDGWSVGIRAPAERAFQDSLIGFSRGEAPVELVGLEQLPSNPNTVVGIRGGVPGETWARALLDRGPLSIAVGHRGSGATNGAARVYAAAGVPMIAPNASSRSEADVEAWVFRLLPTDEAQGRSLAAYAIDSLGAKRIAVMFVGDAYGAGILGGVRAELASRGLSLVDEVELPNGPCDTDQDGMPRLVTRAMLRRSRPDVVVAAVAPSPSHCVMYEIAKESSATWFLGSDALDGGEIDDWARAHVPVDRIRLVSGWIPREDSATRAFVTAFTQRFGRRPRGTDALLHDAFRLADAAARETNGDPVVVREWLASLGSTRPAWNGITGEVRFDREQSERLHLRGIR